MVALGSTVLWRLTARLTAQLTAALANIGLGHVTGSAVPDRPSRSSSQTIRVPPGRSWSGPAQGRGGRSPRRRRSR